MSYSVQKRESVYLIVEKDTEQVIDTCKSEVRARALCRTLNLGAGFNGLTPPFFLSKFSIRQKERPSKK